MRGSNASGDSLFVGEPPSTYSTIFTPNPPVESLGLKAKIDRSSSLTSLKDILPNLTSKCHFGAASFHCCYPVPTTFAVPLTKHLGVPSTTLDARCCRASEVAPMGRCF
jgi:hypothetical protein